MQKLLELLGLRKKIRYTSIRLYLYKLYIKIDIWIQEYLLTILLLIGLLQRKISNLSKDLLVL